MGDLRLTYVSEGVLVSAFNLVYMASIAGRKVALDLNDGEFPDICEELTASVSVTGEDLVRNLSQIGQVDLDRDLTFLLTLVQARVEDPDILAKMLDVRAKILERAHLSAADFVLLTQRLKYLAFYSNGLNIKGDAFRGGLDLEGLIVGGKFNAAGICVRGDLNMGSAVILDDNSQDGARVDRNCDQTGLRVKRSNHQSGMNVEGALVQNLGYVGESNYQTHTRVGGDLLQREAQFDGSNFQTGARVGGDLNQIGLMVGAERNGGNNNQAFMRVGGRLLQSGMVVRGVNDQAFAEIDSDSSQEEMKVVENDQEGMVVKGAVNRDRMVILLRDQGRGREFHGVVSQKGIEIGGALPRVGAGEAALSSDDFEGELGTGKMARAAAGPEVGTGARGRLKPRIIKRKA